MPQITDRIRATKVLDDVLKTLDIDATEWVKTLRFSSPNKKIKSLLRKRLNSVAQILGWGNAAWPEIPPESSLSFVIDALDGSLLEAPIIRKNLVEWLLETRPESSLSPLMRALNCTNLQDLPQIAADYEFRLSTIFSTQLCTLTGLPLSYAVRGSKDERGPHGIISPIRYPPPLADFQEVVKTKLLQYLEEDAGKALVVMPTGSGKTRTAIDTVLNWIESLGKSTCSILWIADRDELCDQAVETFEMLAPSIITQDVEYWRYWRGHYAEIRDSPSGLIVPGITVTTVQQLRSRLSNHEPAAHALISNSDVIIIDEAHRNLDWIEDLARNLEENQRPTRMIGLTATPYRSLVSETGRLSTLFNHRACVPIPGGEHDPEQMSIQLTEMGILAERIDLQSSDLIDTTSEGKKEIDIIRNLINQGSKSIIVFTNDVEEARTLSAILRLDIENPIRAEHIEASTPFATRRKTISSFRNGEIEVLFNYGILTTGFDAPCIDSVVIFRRVLDNTSSLFAQMIGRGLRGPKFGGTQSCSIVHYRGY